MAIGQVCLAPAAPVYSAGCRALSMPGCNQGPLNAILQLAMLMPVSFSKAHRFQRRLEGRWSWNR